MINGNFFSIPERPADVERLWRTASRLDVARLPDWLTAEDAQDYRFVSMLDRRLSAEERSKFDAERTILEYHGFFADEDPACADVLRFYMRKPKQQQHWSIGIYEGPSLFELSPATSVQNPVLTRDDVSDVPAEFVADPFMVRTNERWHMFFEVMNWRSHVGEIGLATSDDGRRWRYESIVLAESFHLSYPHVFQLCGDFYLIPESFQAGGVRLYRARSFPFDWEHVATLVEGDYLVDASVVEHDKRWWMFVDGSTAVAHDTLRLYVADRLEGPWREHPSSPVRTNSPQEARPAGRLVRDRDRLVRFAQSSSPEYGTDVRVLEIVELTANTYRERAVGSGPILGPSGRGWNSHGMHHIDPHRLSTGTWIACVDGWTMTDSNDN